MVGMLYLPIFYLLGADIAWPLFRRYLICCLATILSAELLKRLAKVVAKDHKQN